MPITFVGSRAISQGGAASGTWTAVFNTSLDETGATANIQPGDLHIFVVMYAGEPNIPDRTYNPPAGWTRLARWHDQGAAQSVTGECWARFLSNPVETSITVPHSGHVDDGAAALHFIFRGVDPAILDVPAIATGKDVVGTTRPNLPAITPVTPGALIFQAYGNAASTGALFTAPTDMSQVTNHFQSSRADDVNDAVVGGGIHTLNWQSGTVDPIGSATGAGSGDTWAGFLLALKPADSSGGTTNTQFTINSYSTDSPTLGAPTLPETANTQLSIGNFSAGSPSYVLSGITQRHSVQIGSTSIGTPSLGSPSIAVRHSFPIGHFAVGAPSFDAPTISNSPPGGIVIPAFSVGNPVYGAAAIRQQHKFSIASFATGSPQVGGPNATSTAGPFSIPTFSTSSPTFNAPPIQIEVAVVPKLLSKWVLHAEPEQLNLSADLERR